MACLPPRDDSAARTLGRWQEHVRGAWCRLAASVPDKPRSTVHLHPRSIPRASQLYCMAKLWCQSLCVGSRICAVWPTRLVELRLACMSDVDMEHVKDVFRRRIQSHPMRQSLISLLQFFQRTASPRVNDILRTASEWGSAGSRHEG